MIIEDLSYYIEGIKHQDRNVLSKAITLIESTLEKHEKIALKIVEYCFEQKKKSKIIGISGSPGVGKSTFINALGKIILDKNKNIAILAIDPSSSVSKGSILGDKTRMNDIVQNENVYIRPSPNGDYLGGVARKTYETSIVCEAFGFDYIIIETVGVGQSEIEVRNIVDLFLLLLLPNAGDELQGIKRGIMELADIIVINKAEHENIEKAKISASQIKSVLPLLNNHHQHWETKVITSSALQNTNIENVYNLIQNFYENINVSEYRQNHNQYWINKILNDAINYKIKNNIKIKEWIDNVSNDEHNFYSKIEQLNIEIDKLLNN